MTSEKKIITQTNLPKIWLFMLLLGVASTIISIPFQTAIFSFVLPVIFLLSYVAAGFYHGAAKPIYDSFGDSVYYLGFLFTLIALTGSMFVISQQVGRIEIEDTVLRFSLALVTTIIGLGVLIWISSFLADTGSTTRELQQELKSATLRFINDLEQLSSSAETIGESIHDSLRESVQKSQTLTQKTLEHATTSIIKSAEVFETGIDNINSKFTDFTIPTDIFTKCLGAPIDAFALVLENHQKILNGIVENQKEIKNSTRLVAEGLNGTSSKLEQFENALDAISVQLKNSGEASVKVVNLSDQVESLAGNINKITEQISLQAKDAQQVQQSLMQLASFLTQFPTKLKSAISNIDSTADGISNVLTNISSVQMEAKRLSESMGGVVSEIENLGTTTGTLITGFTKLKSNLGDIDTSGSTLSDFTTSIERELAKFVKSIESHNKELEKELERSRKNVEAISNHMVSAAEFVSKRLS